MKIKDNIKNYNFFKLLNDDVFWTKFTRICLSNSRINLLREYRTKYKIPTRAILKNFIDEDYRFITGDNRDTRDIILYLLSEKNENQEKI